MLAARARRRRLIRRLSIVTPVAALFFYLAVRTRPTPSTPTPVTPTPPTPATPTPASPAVAVAATPKPPAVVATPKKPPAVVQNPPDVAAALAVLSKRVRKVLARNNTA